MRRVLVNLVVESLLAGHSVTYMSPFEKQASEAYREVSKALLDMEARFVSKRNNWIELKNGAFMQLGSLKLTGASVLHTPVVIMESADVADPVAVQELRCVAAGGVSSCRHPIIIEC